MWGVHEETYTFDSTERSYGKYKLISPWIIPERERETEREREKNHVRKIPREIYRLYDLFWPDCSEIFKARNIDVCFKMGPFLSFFKSRKTYSGRSFSLISLSFISPPKNKRITWHSLLHRRFYLFIPCFIDLWGGNVRQCLWHVTSNRLSTHRNTQEDKCCLWMSVHPLVNVASTCGRKKKKTCLGYRYL